jgi:hypothetical protein
MIWTTREFFSQTCKLQRNDLNQIRFQKKMGNQAQERETDADSEMMHQKAKQQNQ